MRSLYDILEILPSSSQEEVRLAFKRRALQAHVWFGLDDDCVFGRYIHIAIAMTKQMY